MSGGHFMYGQLSELAYEIDEIAGLAETNTPNEYGSLYGYSDEVVSRFRECASLLRRANAMVRLIDYMMEGDIGDEKLVRDWPSPSDFPPSSTKTEEKTSE